MIRIFPRYSNGLAMIFLMFVITAVPAVVPADDTAVAVVVSRKIRPYVQVTDGILDQVSQTGVRADVFFLSPGDDVVTGQVVNRLMEDGYDLLAAVGPEAAGLVWEPDIPGRKIYAALLDPDTVPGLPKDACGISLRIPVPVQVRTLADTFPSLQTIGLLFDPAHNQWFFDAALSAGTLGQSGVEIVPLAVTARNRIGQVLNDGLGRVDAVWMIPDQTVISEKLIQYVIKQALYANTGVIGYNPYFIRAGAVFSFEFDYLKLGNQAGEAIVRYLVEKECVPVPPVFDTRINRKMVDKLGIETGEAP